jgi:peptidoglycan hydrolase CwlO-like protein
MSTSEALTLIASVGGIGGAYAIWDGVRKRIAAKAQGDIAVTSAITLLKPLQDRVKELQGECEDLRQQVRDLSDEVEHQRLVINETTSKLEAANQRADVATQRASFYQQAFDQRAGN